MNRPVLIRNGLLDVGDPSGAHLSSLLIMDGKIAAVSDLSKKTKQGKAKPRQGSTPEEADFSEHLLDTVANADVLDADGCIVMPGGIDPHVHFELVANGLHVADNFRVASLAALYGGNTCVIEHPSFGRPGCDLFDPLQLYSGVESFVDYGIHLVFQPPAMKGGQNPSDWPQLEKIPAAVTLGYASGKAYTTYGGKLDDAHLLQLMEAVEKAGCLLTVHCEDDSIIARQHKILDPFTLSHHPLSRPPQAEARAAANVLELARSVGVPIYIVHVSCAETLQVIREARAHGQIVYAETCPQYLLLDDSLYAGPDGLDYVLTPPLRKHADNQVLWEALAEGEIDVVATDHCYFSRVQKQVGRESVFQCPSGIPGVETRLPLLFGHGVLAGRISLERFIQVCAQKPAEIFGLKHKGALVPGRDADILVIDPKQESGLSIKNLHQPLDYSPFETICPTARGWPRHMLLRGEILIRDSHLNNINPQGEYARRQR